MDYKVKRSNLAYVESDNELSKDELMHYGVLGMKWGVRRSIKQLNTNNSKAVDSLNKHRAKSTNAISKLDSKNSKLTSNREKAQFKAEKMRSKADKNYYTTVGEEMTRRRLRKMRKLDRKVNKLDSKISKNDKLRETFNKGINEIDSALIENGKKRFKEEIREIELMEKYDEGLANGTYKINDDGYIVEDK